MESMEIETTVGDVENTTKTNANVGEVGHVGDINGDRIIETINHVGDELEGLMRLMKFGDFESQEENGIVVVQKMVPDEEVEVVGF